MNKGGLHTTGWRVTAATAGWLMAVAAAIVPGQSRPSPALLRSHPAIAYSSTAGNDEVARLGEQLKSGAVSLQFDPVSGYLAAVLEALKIPADSQMLVFSKTSFQAPKINPQNPRALYFNDQTSVGWVRGGDVLEFAAHDPRQGTIFYVMKQDARQARIERNDTCIACHTWEGTQHVPGMFVGSLFPGTDGTPMYGAAFTIDQRSPFEERWGGWYVTGTHSGARHMGNAMVTNPADVEAMITPQTVHTTSLDGRFERTGYASSSSDIVSLLIFEHQSQMLNYITRVGWEARAGSAAGRPLADAVSELVDYMLFVDEAPLPGPIVGSTGFAAEFSARGRRDSRGRSLRDLDLRTRLLRYPCSYLIHSESFDALPADAKSAIYARLWQVLSGADAAEKYRSLSAEDRQAILDILRDTKPDLPEIFATASSHPVIGG